MIQDSELVRLEKIVEKMMTRFSELRKERNRLQRSLREKNALIEELRDHLSARDVERGEISQRVNKIVAQIEDWEKSFVNDLKKEPVVDQVGEDFKEGEEKMKQPDLFSMTDGDR